VSEVVCVGVFFFFLVFVYLGELERNWSFCFQGRQKNGSTTTADG
jgi:hypothetical protein